ncbi:MAG TPA: hypothetical protein VGJ83_07095 [Gemmatimonadales bacterium]|jgi:anti-sigma factor RsiW
MNHPHEDDLLLLAYGELDDAAVAELERHLTACDSCREQLIRLERTRAALSWTPPQRVRPARSVMQWVAVGALAAAAAVAGVVLGGRPPQQDRPETAVWPGPLDWSPTAGYLAGGKAVITIDEQLTRLERERSYVTP